MIRFKSLKLRIFVIPNRLNSNFGNPIKPKTSKADAASAEKQRRIEEIILREKRLYRFTKEGQRELNELLGPIRSQITSQGELVRKIKARNDSAAEVTAEVAKLKKLRRTLEKTEAELTAEETLLDFNKFESFLKQKFFYSQSAELYGGAGGLVDYGPVGLNLKNNIISKWRREYLSSENAFEVETSIITHKKILDASGHSQKFADYVVKDTVNGECFRFVDRFHF